MNNKKKKTNKKLKSNLLLKINPYYFQRKPIISYLKKFMDTFQNMQKHLNLMRILLTPK